MGVKGTDVTGIWDSSLEKADPKDPDLKAKNLFLKDISKKLPLRLYFKWILELSPLRWIPLIGNLRLDHDLDKSFSSDYF